jgi:hypothetical protein
MKRIALLIVACLSAWGQSEKARIVGTVVDVTGAVIPGAKVVAKDSRTGQQSQATSDEKGLYVLNNLTPSSYDLTASSTGLSQARYSEVRVTVGQERTVNITLQPATVTTEVTVSGGELSTIDTSSARIGAEVDAREVASLPLNGRQISQLYLIAPGAQTAGGGSFDNIRFSGRSNQQNVIKYDGVAGGGIIDQSPGNLNGESSSLFRLQSSLENVQEFRIESSNYPAEYGTGTGGQVSVVTKSGSNAFHGGLFEYVRNNNMDARNFFDGASNSVLKLNQFGGSIGGPIRKDKLFFFVSQENFFQRAGLNFVNTVPSAAAKAQAQANAATNPKIAAILPLLAAYPVGQRPSSNPLLDIASLNSASRVNEFYGSLRLDYHASDKDTISFRYFRDQGDSFEPLDVTSRAQNFTLVPQNAMISWTRVLSPTVVNEFKLGLNASKSRSTGIAASSVPGLDLAPITVSFTGAVAIPGIGGQGASAGAAQLGGLIRANSAYNTSQQPYTNWEMPIMDTLSWIKGSHNVKFGVEFRPIRMETDRFGGTTYTFGSIDALLANTPSAIQFNAPAGLPSPWNNGQTGPRHLQQEYFVTYVQDEWKATPELTINYGLRYEYFGVMHERDNRDVVFNIVTGQIDPSNKPWYTASKLNFAPRLGIAYAPSRYKGNTVFRIGAGFFNGPGQPEDTIQPAESDRVSRTLSSNIQYPLDIPATIAGYDINSTSLGFQPRAYATGYKVPERILSYTASLQQKLPGDTVLTTAFVGSQGRNLFLRGLANQVIGVTQNPTTGVGTAIRQFGNRFAEIDYKTSGGNDHYNSLQTTINRRFSKGLTFGLQHTWGRSIGDTNGSNEAVTAGSLQSFAYDYGNNSYDVRHSLNLTALWEIPVGKGKKADLGRVGNYIVGGWELGGVYNFRTGLPIQLLLTRNDIVYRDRRNGKIYGTPVIVDGFVETDAMVNSPGGGSSRQFRRPDVVGGVDPFIVGGDRLAYLNPAAFAVPQPGTYGNLSRNALVGPNLAQVDLTLHKRLPLTERVNLEFRAEVYNLFNRANFANPPATLALGLPNGYTASSGSEPTPSGVQPGQSFSSSAAGGAFGRFNSTVANTVGLGAQRQIQLSLRLNF